jgi:hypothetical protein
MPEPRRLPVLPGITIETPCHEPWERMAGSGGIRHCGACDRDVHDLSTMTVAEIEALLAGPDRVCVRFFRRPDGRILTRDCPVGEARRRRRMKVTAVAISAALAGAGAAGATTWALVEQPVIGGENQTTVTSPEPEPEPDVLELGPEAVEPPPVLEMGDPAPRPRPRPRMGMAIKRH